MKIKNIGLPLFICGIMMLFFLYVPEKLSGVYDDAAIGKLTVSKVREEAAGELPVSDRIRLIGDYGKDANIICIVEDYSGMPKEMRETVSAYFEGESKALSREAVAYIQEELDKLLQLSLLPEVSLEDMEVAGASVERYMDIRDDSRYLALAVLDFRKEGTELSVRYDIENKKILMYNYSGDTMITEEEDDALLWQGWSEYLRFGMEDAERYYDCGWYKDVGRQVYSVYMLLL